MLRRRTARVETPLNENSLGDSSARAWPQDKISESEARFASIFNQTQLGIAETDLTGRLTLVNECFCRIVGRSRDELLTLRMQDITHPDDLPANAEQFRLLVEGTGPNFVVEKRYRRADGTAVWVHNDVAAIRDADGKVRHVVAVVADMTERRQAEVDLAALLRRELEARANAELLIEVARTLAAELDLQKLLQVVTDAATTLTGAKFGAFFYNIMIDDRGESSHLYTLSGAPRDAFEKFTTPRNRQLFEPTFIGQRVVRIADVLTDPRYGGSPPHDGMPDGHLPVRSYLAVPVISRSSDVLGALVLGHPDPGVFSDAAERLTVTVAAHAAVAIDNARLFSAAQREIAERMQAEEALRESDRQKNDFLSMLAHELRNPLAPIRSANEVIRLRHGDPDIVRTASAIIERQTDDLVRLVDDLLDISRVSRGKIQLRREPTDLTEAVLRAVEAIRPSCEIKRQNLTASVPREPVYIDADLTRLTQVFTNLMNNASKFTAPGGSVSISAEQGAEQAIVRVKDSGVGIAPDQLARIFELFVQLDASLERAQGGLGIGLTLVKTIVEMHGGHVEVSSAGVGQGSQFVVRLPLLCDTATPAEKLADRRATPQSSSTPKSVASGVWHKV